MLKHKSLYLALASTVVALALLAPRGEAQTSQSAGATQAPAETGPAQSLVIEAEKDVDDSPLLGGEYRDETNLLRFAPPVGVRIIQRPAISKEVMSFVHDGKRWAGGVQIIVPPTGMNPITPARYMEISAIDLAKTLTTEVQTLEINKDLKVSGLPAARQMVQLVTTSGNAQGGGGTVKENMIRQLLCVRIPSMRTPVRDERTGEVKRNARGDIEYIWEPRFMVMYLYAPKTAQKEAYAAFDAMVSHFQVLDPKGVEERRTSAVKAGREFLAKVTAEDVQAKMYREPQIFRMRVDGTDVGYSVFNENTRPVDRDSFTGILTTMDSHSYPAQDTSLHYHGEAFWAFRKNNNKFDDETYYNCWSSYTVNQYLTPTLQQDSTSFNEIGMIALDPSLDIREPERNADGTPKLDEHGLVIYKSKPLKINPGNTNARISISRTGDKRLEPIFSNKQFNWIVEPTMPATLPKVLENTMWPRLVDLTKPARYSFVVFNANAAKMGLRTLAVYSKTMVEIDGKKVEAIKLTDELDPSTTTLYVDDKGKVLLMKTSDGTSLTPSNEAEMVAKWRHRLNIKPAAPQTPVVPGNAPVVPSVRATN